MIWFILITWFWIASLVSILKWNYLLVDVILNFDLLNLYISWNFIDYISDLKLNLSNDDLFMKVYQLCFIYVSIFHKFYSIALSWNMPKSNKETFLTSLENWLCKPYAYCMYSSINNKWIDLIRVTLGAMGIIIIFSLIYLLTDLFTYSNCQPSSRKYPVCVENLIKSVTLTRWPTLNYLYPLLLNCLL